jgi:excisionase family DNA binding protein
MQHLDDKKSIEPVFCRAPEMAAAIPLPLRTFNLRVAEGKIPSYKFGRDRLFKKSEVIAAIERHRVGTADEVLS